MSLPTELQHSIDQALDAILNHPQHLLPSRHRRAIYNAFGAVETGNAEQARVRLAVMTARHVLPVWQHVWPSDSLPQFALRTADDVLQGRVDAQTVEVEVSDASEVLEDLRNTREGQVHLDALFAGQAAISALAKAFKLCSVVSAHLAARINDYNSYIAAEEIDILSWKILWVEENNDTALWAAAAFAGGISDIRPDPAKQRAFWEWWLTEAIPIAWNTELDIAIESGLLRLPSDPIRPQESNHLIQQIFELAHNIRFQFPRSIYDQGVFGQHYAALLAPYLDFITANKPIGMLFTIDRIYRDFFSKLAQYSASVQIVADPSEVSIFYSNGFSIVLAHVDILTALHAAIETFPGTELYLQIKRNPLPPFDKNLGLIILNSLSSPAKELRYIIFAVLLTTAGLSSSIVSQEVERARRGEIHLTWKEVAYIIDEQIERPIN
jgi:hypothetical protein